MGLFFINLICFDSIRISLMKVFSRTPRQCVMSFRLYALPFPFPNHNDVINCVWRFCFNLSCDSLAYVVVLLSQ